jgi:hemerythrin superfamily protein
MRLASDERRPHRAVIPKPDINRQESPMATRRKGNGGGSLAVAIELLAADHRKVEGLFEEYESEKEGDEDTKRELALQICNELTAHAQLEEELFYPWLRENLDEEDMEMLEEAYVEHASAKDLIAQIQAASEIDEAFDAKVKVLSEYVKHHVQEEEGEIFPEVRGEQEELDELGQEMHARKAEIMQQLGLEHDAPPPAARGKGARGAEQRRAR